MVGDKQIAELDDTSSLNAQVTDQKPAMETKIVAKKGIGKKRHLNSKRIRGFKHTERFNVAKKIDLNSADSKKIKRNGNTTPTLPTNESDFNITSSVPSVASTEDSDLPDSVMSPTDEETCSCVTEEEELYGGEDNVSTCSDPGNTTVISTSRVNEEFQPALRFSVFPNIPPFLNFCLHDEKVVELPWPIRRHLKWKLSSITPVVVRKTVVNSGFRIIKEPKDWTGTWGKHMKSFLFRLLLPHQKVNHFPGTFQIGRKDRLWRNLQKMVAKHGVEEFGFLPQTYILPHDLRLLRQSWSRNTTDIPWIIKPPASARGTGIQVIHQWSQLPRKRPLVVQSYVKNPYLINNTKFDIRLYVLVTSIDPLRIYLYEDGLVRFASMTYSPEMKSLSDSFIHLTNYSINKNSVDYVSNEDATLCQGHKWTLKCLWRYLSERGVNVEDIKSSFKDIVIKTLLSVETVLIDMSRSNVSSRYQCFELFGFDVLLDEDLKPWLLEVNISPSLHSSSSLDLSVKGPLIRDVFNMVRFHVPSSLNSTSRKKLSEFISENFQDHVMKKSREAEEGSQYCFNVDYYTAELGEEDKKKQEAFVPNRIPVNSNGGTWIIEDQSSTKPINILENLTENDARHLIETEDELTQAKGFTRLFPSASSAKYFRFMDNVRYYNLLLDEWQKRYGDDRESAITLLKEMCVKIQPCNQ